MAVIKVFWSPCIAFTDLKAACIAIAFYTIATSVVLIALTKYMMNGGVSTQLYSPFFENDVRNSVNNVWREQNFLYICVPVIANVLSLIFYGRIAIGFLFYMVIAGCAVIHGVATSLRGFLLPWLFGMFLVIVFQFLWPIWLLYAYYIYIQIVVPAIIYVLWGIYNLYCWLCVYTHYKYINRMQSPDIEFVYA